MERMEWMVAFPDFPFREMVDLYAQPTRAGKGVEALTLNIMRQSVLPGLVCASGNNVSPHFHGARQRAAGGCRTPRRFATHAQRFHSPPGLGLRQPPATLAAGHIGRLARKSTRKPNDKSLFCAYFFQWGAEYAAACFIASACHLMFIARARKRQGAAAVQDASRPNHAGSNFGQVLESVLKLRGVTRGCEGI
jgi:hypothetical protein